MRIKKLLKMYLTITKHKGLASLNGICKCTINNLCSGLCNKIQCDHNPIYNCKIIFKNEEK